MMLYKAHIVAAFYIASTIASTAETSAEKECGDLGILSFNISSLPPGVDAQAIRKCAGHPLGRPPSIQRRACWHGKPSGCSKEFCWRKCENPDSGFWCWTAHNGGMGAWIGCKADTDCNEGQACGVGECDDCGCSC